MPDEQDKPGARKAVEIETGFDDPRAPKRPLPPAESAAPPPSFEPAKPPVAPRGPMPSGLNLETLKKLVEHAEAVQKAVQQSPPAQDPSLAAHEFRLKSDQSEFAATSDTSKLANLFGRAGTPDAATAAPPPPPTTQYDGCTPAAEVTARDVWKAITAPVQSREGQRSPELYLQVIDQFAVGNNPRYSPDAPDKYRAHIFIWDVTRAMGCEVPHFVGPKELTLGQTVDWIRNEGPMRGWFKTELATALQALAEGKPVLAMPKDIKIKLVAIARPGPVTRDGKPLVSAAAKQAGNGLTVSDAFGVFAVEWFFHP